MASAADDGLLKPTAQEALASVAAATQVRKYASLVDHTPTAGVEEMKLFMLCGISAVVLADGLQ